MFCHRQRPHRRTPHRHWTLRSLLRPRYDYCRTSIHASSRCSHWVCLAFLFFSAVLTRLTFWDCAFSTRAARLSACGIAAVVSKQGLLDGPVDPKNTIGIATDGSLYNVRSLLPCSSSLTLS